MSYSIVCLQTCCLWFFKSNFHSWKYETIRNFQNVSNLNLFSSLHRTCMMQTLRFTMATLEYVKAKGVEVRFHGRGKNEASHYCGQCEVRLSTYFWTTVSHKHPHSSKSIIQNWKLFNFFIKFSNLTHFLSTDWSVQHFIHPWARETSCRPLHELCAETSAEPAGVRVSRGVSVERVSRYLW